MKSCLVSPISLKYNLSDEIESLYSLLELSEVCELNGWAPKFEKLPPSEIKMMTSSAAFELKPLPSTLKYVFLGKHETFPVVISSNLDKTQDAELLTILKNYRNFFRWTIADIKGISPLICAHHIYLEEDVKPSNTA